MSCLPNTWGNPGVYVIVCLDEAFHRCPVGPVHLGLVCFFFSSWSIINEQVGLITLVSKPSSYSERFDEIMKYPTHYYIFIYLSDSVTRRPRLLFHASASTPASQSKAMSAVIASQPGQQTAPRRLQMGWKNISLPNTHMHFSIH